jgi:hypothetical protein
MRMEALARPVAGAPAAADEPGTALAGTPWSLRRARGPGTRPALELYEAGDLADIIVATRVGSRTLRGACRTGRGGQALALAWGRLPADGGLVTVMFAARRPLRGIVQAQVLEVAGLAWFAVAAGRFTVVTASCHQGCEGLRLQAGRL